MWFWTTVVGWVLAAAALTACRVASRRAREDRKRERVQAATAKEAVEQAQRNTADAEKWRSREGEGRRDAEQFASITEAMPEMAGLGERIREQVRRRRIRRVR